MLFLSLEFSSDVVHVERVERLEAACVGYERGVTSALYDDVRDELLGGALE